MEIIISGRDFDVTDELKEHITSKLAKLVEEYPKLTTARVVMETERNWHLAEARVNGKGIELDATGRTDDMYATLDDVADKLERQLLKFREKISDRRRSQKFAEAEKTQGPLLAEDADEDTENVAE